MPSPTPSRSASAFPLDDSMTYWAERAERWAAVSFVDSCLRGVGQIVFMNNPVSGLLMLIGMFAASRWLGVATVIGVGASTVAAYALRLDRAQIRAGLHGYNGALVGAALATFLQPAWSGVVVVSVILVAAASTIVMVATTAVLARSLNAPPLTLPFNFVTLPFLWAAFAVARVRPGPIAPVGAIAESADTMLHLSAGALLEALLRGIGQLYFADNIVAGLLILLGILVCSRSAFVFALVGSAVGSLTGVALGADGSAIVHGFWGYNAYVTAVAIAGVFLVLTLRTAVYAVAAAVAATLLYAGLGAILGSWGLPVLTVPFCLVTIGVVAAVASREGTADRG